MNQDIFKAYDIRGIYPADLDEKSAYKIGRAMVKFLKAKTIAVGRDIRESGPPLFYSLKEGIIDQGADVIDLDLVTTPMLYFASGKLDVDGGVMVTASHNPPQYNGMKLCRKNAVPIGENSGMFDIKKLSLEESLDEVPKKGKITQQDISEEYFIYISSFMNLGDEKFKIVVDTANAMGIMELEIYRRFSYNIDLIPLFDTFDSKFPNHEANPAKPETLKDLQAKVLKENANLGIAYDGDADRICFVDEKGEVIPMDLITALIAKMILKKKPGSLILYDLRSSMSVKEIIEENGGKAHECRVGHALIKKQMVEEGAAFAGELSGHYYFQENYFAEAATLAAIYLLNHMAETKKKISEIVAEAKRYFHSGEINSEVKDKDAVIKKLKETYQGGKVSEIDGIKISYWDGFEKGKRWWFNVRPSNTEPVLRLNLEADNQALMEKKKGELLKIIRG